jgi:SAM-dependent methyltransferase
VLELGCGTGRITLPLARAGFRVTGIDAKQTMLDSLAHKLAFEPIPVRGRVTLRRDSFLELGGDERFPLVILPFNAIHHCQSHRDVLALLDGVRRVLAPGGLFVLDLYFPDPILYARPPDKRFEERLMVHPTSGLTFTSWEQGWYEPQTQVHHVRYHYHYADGRHVEMPLDLRMFYPQELRALLDWARFAIVSEASDFEGEPVDGKSTKWVLVLRPA